MRILLLTQWYPPEPMKLLSEMAESLQQLGHDVEVLTGFPNYPRGSFYDGYRIRFRQREVIGGVPVVRVPLYPDHSRSAMKRIANYLSFALSAATIGMWSTRRPDVIIAYGSPYTIAIAAAVHGAVRRVPFVFDVVDLWPESIGASGMMRAGVATSFAGAFARWVYRRATKIVAVSPGFLRRIVDAGVPAAKVAVVTTWADTDYFSPRAADAATLDRFQLRGKFNVLFAGAIGPAQGLETIVDAAAALQSSPAIQITIAGGGIALDAARQRADDMRLTNIRFVGQLPSSDMPPLFAAVDVLLVHLRPDPLYDITIPHKIFAYMASGKAVLAAVAGDAAEIVASASAGVTCASGDAAAMASTICKMASMPRAELDAMGANARKAAETLYSRPHLIRMLSDVLESAVRDYSVNHA